VDKPFPNLRSLAHRSAKELLVYVGISALIIGTIFAMLAAGLPWDAFVKWFGLAFNTSVIFWYLALCKRTLWRKQWFWIFMIACLAVHCGLWIAILIHIEHWKWIWFFPMIAEVALFMSVGEQLRKAHIRKFGKSRSDKTHNRRVDR
jgi:hypothetical protein